MSRGGKRVGSGRPKGSNHYGEPTKPMRIPESRLQEVKAYLENEDHYSIPYFSGKVRAGVPTLVDDNIEEYINLNNLLIQNPKATFVVRASGDSMINASINDGDMLVIDKQLVPKNNNIVVVSVEGHLTVKRLIVHDQSMELKAENEHYSSIYLKEEDNFSILGVVTNVIHQTL